MDTKRVQARDLKPRDIINLGYGWETIMYVWTDTIDYTHVHLETSLHADITVTLRRNIIVKY